MQDNEVSLEQLKSVYKAHTEAYLDFNMALINILSNQKEIINKVESLKVLSDEEFKNLSKEYAVLEKLFENFQMTQTKRDADLEEATIEYTAQISNFGSDIEEMKTELKSMKKIYSHCYLKCCRIFVIFYLLKLSTYLRMIEINL